MFCQQHSLQVSCEISESNTFNELNSLHGWRVKRDCDGERAWKKMR